MLLAVYKDASPVLRDGALRMAERDAPRPTGWTA